MKILKCKFSETTAKSIRLLRRHIAKAHPKESGEVKQFLDGVDAKQQSLSEAHATTPNGFIDRLGSADKSNPDYKKLPTDFLQNRGGGRFLTAGLQNHDYWTLAATDLLQETPYLFFGKS